MGGQGGGGGGCRRVNLPPYYFTTVDGRNHFTPGGLLVVPRVKGLFPSLVHHPSVVGRRCNFITKGWVLVVAAAGRRKTKEKTGEEREPPVGLRDFWWDRKHGRQ